MKTTVSHSLEETGKIAAEWLEHISVHPLYSTIAGEALVVGLSGHLGSGKTTFVQSVALSLGIKEFVTSPTFVIMKIYPTENDLGSVKRPWKRLIHIDAYRLEKGRELEVLDFEKLVSDPKNLILIEWPENVKEALPENATTITFEATGDDERTITI